MASHSHLLTLHVLVSLLASLPHPTLSSTSPPPLPLNWTTQYACAPDTPTRVLTNPTTHQLPYTNTPATCIALCDALSATYAGVEYADECHCGSGLVAPAPDAVPAEECDMPCAGDPDVSCGGSWRIQIYKSPALPPSSWALQGCFLDTPTARALSNATHHTFPSNTELVAQCIARCQRAGMRWAGVEGGADCQCSVGGYAHAGQGGQGEGGRVDEGECNATCPLPGGAGSEYCGGFERLMVYQYQG